MNKKRLSSDLNTQILNKNILKLQYEAEQFVNPLTFLKIIGLFFCVI